jgi:hypothetical protein
MGIVILTIQVYNPTDSRNVNLQVETYDNQNRMIGKSRSDFFYSANPLPLNATVAKS